METVKGPDSSPECRLTRLVDQYQAVLLQIDDIVSPVRAYVVTVGAKTGTVVDTYTPEPAN